MAATLRSESGWLEVGGRRYPLVYAHLVTRGGAGFGEAVLSSDELPPTEEYGWLIASDGVRVGPYRVTGSAPSADGRTTVHLTALVPNFSWQQAEAAPQMTEEDWLTSTDPERMLRHLSGASARKMRLFACACARRVDDAGGDLDYWEWEADNPQSSGGTPDHDRRLPFLNYSPPVAACVSASRYAWVQNGDGELAVQCDLLRCLFGNPFRPVHSAGMTVSESGAETAVRVARLIYDSRRFGDLPVLADAMEEAGCTDPAVLDHLRGPGPHARGCWVVDLLLGRQ